MLSTLALKCTDELNIEKLSIHLLFIDKLIIGIPRKCTIKTIYI